MLHDDRLGDTPPAGQTTNLFLAVQPTATAAADAFSRGQNQRRMLGMRGRQRPEDVLHMTLIGLGGGLGRAPSAYLNRLKRAVGKVSFPQFDVVLDRTMSFRSSGAASPFVLVAEDEVVPAQALRLALMRSLEATGASPPLHRRMTPHMTLLYDRTTWPIQPVAPVWWTAREFVLIESWVGRTKHVVLDAWPLRAPKI